MEVEALLPVERQGVVELELQARRRLLMRLLPAGSVVLPLLPGASVGLGRGALGCGQATAGGESRPHWAERQLRLQLHPPLQAQATGGLLLVELLHPEELGCHGGVDGGTSTTPRVYLYVVLSTLGVGIARKRRIEN